MILFDLDKEREMAILYWNHLFLYYFNLIIIIAIIINGLAYISCNAIYGPRNHTHSKSSPLPTESIPFFTLRFKNGNFLD